MVPRSIWMYVPSRLVSSHMMMSSRSRVSQLPAAWRASRRRETSRAASCNAVRNFDRFGSNSASHTAGTDPQPDPPTWYSPTDPGSSESVPQPNPTHDQTHRATSRAARARLRFVPSHFSFKSWTKPLLSVLVRPTMPTTPEVPLRLPRTHCGAPPQAEPAPSPHKAKGGPVGSASALNTCDG